MNEFLADLENAWRIEEFIPDTSQRLEYCKEIVSLTRRLMNENLGPVLK